MTQPQIAQTIQSPGRQRLAVQVAAFLVAYLALGWVSFRTMAPLPSFFVAWLPGGLLVALLILTPPRRWGWFALAALGANLLLGRFFGLEPRLNLAFSFGSVLEILIAVWVPYCLKRPLRLNQDRWEIIYLTSLGMTAGGLLNVGLAGLVTWGSPFAAQLTSAWSVWWLGHLLGTTVTTVFCLTWITPPALSPITRRQAAGLGLEILLLLAALLLFYYYRSTRMEEMVFVTIPIIFWLALRHNPYGLTAGVLLITIHLAVNLTQVNTGLNAAALVKELLPVQAYIGLAIFSGLGSTIYLDMLKRTSQAQASAESQKQLAEMELLYRSVFEQSNDGMVIFDPATQLPSVFNDQACRMLGYTREEYAALRVTDIDAQENPEETSLHIQKVIAQGSDTFETLHRARDGQMRSIQVSVSVISRAGQKVMLTTFHDITGRKQVENELRASVARFRAIFEHARLGFSLVDLSGHFLETNPAMHSILGFTRADFKELLVENLCHPEDRDKDNQPLNELIAGSIDNYSVEKRLLHKNGQYITANLTITAVRDERAAPLYIIGMIEDITARQQADERLRFQAHLLEVVSQAIITTDLGGQISYWNRAAEELFGWKASEALGRDMVDLTIHSVTHDEKQQILNWLGSGGRWSGETQMRRRDGSTFLGQADDSPILDSQDRLVGIISITQDITARRAAEDALRKSNFMRDILSASLMNTPLALVFWKITHGQSEILDWNPAAEATFGWLREEVIGKSFALFLAPRAGAIQPASASDSWFANGPMPNRMQCQSLTRSGQAQLMEWFNTSLSDLASNDDAVYILSLGENITERQLREEQLRASLQEKEILLREVYHRVKNNLMIMISLIDLQSANITDQNTLAILKDLQARVRTMALVHQSLYQSTSLSQVDFEGYLIALISYLSSLYNATHKVEITFAVENLSLRIETAIPCGLIINELVSNAYKYAFPEEFGEEAECRVHIGFNKIGEKYVLDVKDNGIGMPEGFDLANSPSLGIQMVYILTNQIDGTIELLPTQGTHFHITFAERAVAPLKGAGA